MKKSIYAGSLLCLAATGCATAEKPQEVKPNIIFILADDLGYGDISCLNPDSKIQTPNIDQMAKDGQTYTDAHSSSSVSTPSRYGVMTGRYCWRTDLKGGVLGGFGTPLIEKDRPTLGSMLKGEGYNTAAIGKWHLGMGWTKNDGSSYTFTQGRNLKEPGFEVNYEIPITDGPNERGFDYYYGVAGSLDMPPYLLIENNKVIEKSSQKFEPGEKHTFGNRPGYAVAERDAKEFLPMLANKMEEKIEELSGQDKPFFLYFALTAPHAPIAPADEFGGKSQAGDYGDFVVQVDNTVARVMAALEKQGIDDNTIVVLTSDNGPETYAYKRAAEFNHFSAGQLKGVKRDLWEGGHRVPFFVKWPEKVEANTTVNNTICLTDFFATAAQVVGHQMQEKEAPDSYSLLPLMQGEAEFDRPYTIHHSGSGKFAIRKGDWVLIDKNYGDDNFKKVDSKKYHESRGYDYEYVTKQSFLFNLKDDLREFKNEYDNQSEVAAELEALLKECKNNGN